MSQPLEGIRVLDFSTLLPGPLATLFLAEAGAEVIKIEAPGGDPMRGYAPHWGEDSAGFHLLNRGKASIAIDLKSPAGRDRLLPLIETADILVEQFRPGVMARLGLSYEDVRAVKPDIIYCSITGYGQEGPRALRAGHDLNYQGDTGLLALSFGTADAPVVPPALLGDIAGGTYPALVNILLALRRRDLDGSGTHLDIAMAESLFPLTYWAMAKGLSTGQWPGNGDAPETGDTCRYRLYPTEDRLLVAAAPLEEKFWRAFCEAIGLPQHLRDDRADPAATLAEIARIIASRPAAHWREVFERADCCCTIVRNLQDAMSDPHFRERGIFSAKIAGENGASMTALPVPISPQFRAPAQQQGAAPRHGADTKRLVGEE